MGCICFNGGSRELLVGSVDSVLSLWTVVLDTIVVVVVVIGRLVIFFFKCFF